MLNKSRKLNLGCGEDYKDPADGWVNLDFDTSLSKVDVIHDLERLPLPFNTGYFDYILTDNVLEHLSKPPIDLIRELWRILKINGLLEIRVPHFSHFGAYGFEHQQLFSLGGFNMFNDLFSVVDKKLYYKRFGKADRFVGKKTFYHYFSRAISSLANLSPGFCERFWCFWVGGFQEMKIVLRKNP